MDNKDYLYALNRMKKMAEEYAKDHPNYNATEDIEALTHALDLLKAEGKLTSCAWCKGDWTDNFCVYDEDFFQPLTYRHVKYCPMCGRKLRSPAEEREKNMKKELKENKNEQ